MPTWSTLRALWLDFICSVSGHSCSYLAFLVHKYEIRRFCVYCSESAVLITTPDFYVITVMALIGDQTSRSFL